MSSRAYAAPYTATLRPDERSVALIRCWIPIAYLPAVSALVAAADPAGPAAVVLAAALGGLALELRAAYRLEPAPDRVILAAGGGWRLVAGGETVRAALRPGSVCCRGFAVLAFAAADGRRWRLVLHRRAQQAHSWRRLRLLWRSGHAFLVEKPVS